MKHYILSLSALCCLLLLASCKKEQIFPLASGRPYEVLVVLDNNTWNAPAGRALFDILDTDVPCLPQSERSFHISQIEPKDLNACLQSSRLPQNSSGMN